MKNGEQFLTGLADQKTAIKPETHKILAASPSEYVRRAWADRKDKPKDLLEERLQVETDALTLKILMGDLDIEVVTMLIKRGRTDIVLKEALENYSDHEGNLVLQTLKLAKKLDPDRYAQSIAEDFDVTSDIVFDMWDDLVFPVAQILIEDTPLEFIEHISQEMIHMEAGPCLQGVFTRITSELSAGSVRALCSVAHAKKFTELTGQIQGQLRKFLQTVEPTKLEHAEMQKLEALSWWAGLTPKPTGNPFADTITEARAEPENSAFALPAEATVKEVDRFVKSTNLDKKGTADAFTRWALLHRKEVDHKIVASWLKKIPKSETTLADMLTVADDVLRLRQLAPPWAQKNAKLFLENINAFEEVKSFPLKEVLLYYKEREKIFDLITHFDSKLEIFYAISDTYEGTLGEFLEVINTFKADNA